MASVAITGTDPTTIVFTGSIGEEARALSEVTTADPDATCYFDFSVERGTIWLRIGTTPGGMDIINDASFDPGSHVIDFSPGVTTYFIEWFYVDAVEATLRDFRSLSGDDPQCLQTPWSGSQMRDLRYAQSLNTMWLASGTGPVQTLKRRGVASWSLCDFQPDNGPFAPLNLSNISLTPSDLRGIITVTSSAPLFAEYDVGSLLRITTTGQTVIDTLDAPGDVTASIRVTGIEENRQFQVQLNDALDPGDSVVLERSVGNELSFATVQTFGPGSSAATNIDDEFDNAIIFYRLRLDTSGGTPKTVQLIYSNGASEGVMRITEVLADNEVLADVITPLSSTGGTTLWAFGAWNARFGYPRAVALEDGRLWFFRGNTYWASGSDDFGDFEVGTLADAALSRTVGGIMNTAEWAVGADGKLLLGMRGGEVSIGSSAFDEVIIPANVRARNRTSRGSMNHQAATVDDHAVFISRSRERLYRFGYNPNRDDYDAFHLTRLNRDIGRETLDGGSNFLEIAFAYEPEPRLYIVREDGQCVGCVYDLEEQVVAFYRIKIPDAKILSVCALPGQPEDTVRFAVERTVNGAPYRTIERLAPEHWSEVQDACRLYGAVPFSGSDITNIGNLDHLEGSEVYAWADGRQGGPYTVTGGEITLDEPADVGFVGTLYSGRYKSPRISSSTLSAWKKLERLAIWVYQTAGGGLRWGRMFDEEVMDTIPDATEDFLVDGPIEVFSEDYEFPLEGATKRDPRLYIEAHTAGPATVLALAPIVEYNER